MLHNGGMDTESNTNKPNNLPQYKDDQNSRAQQIKNTGQNAWRIVKKGWTWAAQAIGSLFLIVLIVAILASIFSQSSAGGATVASEKFLYGQGANKIVVIPAEGIIGEAGSSLLGSGVGVSAEAVSGMLQQAKQDPLVKAVVLQVNSPGGSAVASDQIFQSIQDFRKDSGKPVVASFGDTAASGGYYIAAAADKIVANPSTLTGSIGVIMEFYNATGLLENIGVDPQTIKSGQYKDLGSFSRDATSQERQILQSIVDDAHSQFVNRVAEGRNMEQEQVVKLADGRIYTGKQAKENGLVDDLGNLNRAVDVAKGLANASDVSVVKYVQGGLWGSFLSSASKASLLTSLLGLASDTSAPTGLQYRWSP